MEWKYIYKHYRLFMARSEINTKYGQQSTKYLQDSHSLAILVCNPFYKTRWCDYIHVSSCKMHCSLSGISVHNNPIHILKKIKISLEKKINLLQFLFIFSFYVCVKMAERCNFEIKIYAKQYLLCTGLLWNQVGIHLRMIRWYAHKIQNLGSVHNQTSNYPQTYHCRILVKCIII